METSKEELAYAGPNKETVNVFACISCGADLNYKPGTRHLTCTYCNAENEIPDSGEPVNENDFYEYINNSAATSAQMTISVVSCSACGANTTIDPNIRSHSCPYCMNPLVVKDAHTDSVIQPKAVLPFKLNKDEVRNKFKAWVKGLWFAPNDLKKASVDTDRFNGMYIPYWTFDSNTQSSYIGQRGDYYYVNVNYTATENGKTVTKTRRDRKIRWHTVSGNVSHAFDDVLVIASHSLPLKYAEKLEPWDLENLTGFNESFLGGFITEKYKVELKEGFDTARNKMDDHIRTLVRKNIGGDQQRIINLNTKHSDITFKHILLPIYISAFRFKGKVYNFLVNGRTGEVQGERPYSAWKIALLVIAILAVIGVVAYFATRK